MTQCCQPIRSTFSLSCTHCVTVDTVETNSAISVSLSFCRSNHKRKPSVLLSFQNVAMLDRVYSLFCSTDYSDLVAFYMTSDDFSWGGTVPGMRWCDDHSGTNDAAVLRGVPSELHWEGWPPGYSVGRIEKCIQKLQAVSHAHSDPQYHPPSSEEQQSQKLVALHYSCKTWMKTKWALNPRPLGAKNVVPSALCQWKSPDD